MGCLYVLGSSAAFYFCWYFCIKKDTHLNASSFVTCSTIHTSSCITYSLFCRSSLSGDVSSKGRERMASFTIGRPAKFHPGAYGDLGMISECN